MKRGLVLVLALVQWGCGPPRWATTPEPEPLPVLGVEQVVGVDAVIPVPADPAPERAEPRVTLTATDTDLRPLLAALADAAGVSLVLAPEVRGRVTVRFEDVPALEALHEVIRASGHMIAEPLALPWGPTVFYVPPVDVNRADAATIQARFGVSPELARFLVWSRAPLN